MLDDYLMLLALAIHITEVILIQLYVRYTYELEAVQKGGLIPGPNFRQYFPGHRVIPFSGIVRDGSSPHLESRVTRPLRARGPFINDMGGTTYSLKKNSILAMPSAIVHGSDSGWGPDAKGFNASRFIESQANVKVTASSNRVLKRVFGGGSCDSHVTG